MRKRAFHPSAVDHGRGQQRAAQAADTRPPERACTAIRRGPEPPWLPSPRPSRVLRRIQAAERLCPTVLRAVSTPGYLGGEYVVWPAGSGAARGLRAHSPDRRPVPPRAHRSPSAPALAAGAARGQTTKPTPRPTGQAAADPPPRPRAPPPPTGH